MQPKRATIFPHLKFKMWLPLPWQKSTPVLALPSWQGFIYGKAAAPAFLYSHTPFLLLGFVFQFIARHLLYSPERYSVGKLRNFPTLLSHVCPVAVCFYGYPASTPEEYYMQQNN